MSPKAQQIAIAEADEKKEDHLHEAFENFVFHVQHSPPQTLKVAHRCLLNAVDAVILNPSKQS